MTSKFFGICILCPISAMAAGNSKSAVSSGGFQAGTERYWNADENVSADEKSGIKTQRGQIYYSVKIGEKTYPLRSVEDIKNLYRPGFDDELAHNGINDPTAAFEELCHNKEWTNSEKEVARGSSLSCAEGKMRVYSSPNSSDSINLQITSDKIVGEMKIAGCKSKVSIDSKKVWQRKISTKDFDALVEIGNGDDFILKISVDKIKKSCDQSSKAPKIMVFKTNY